MNVARFGFVLALATAFLAACGSPIPPPGNYATISGTVVDESGKGVSDAVVVVNAVQFATTDGPVRLRPLASPERLQNADADRQRAGTPTGRTTLDLDRPQT
jgi:hypothetical protein